MVLCRSLQVESRISRDDISAALEDQVAGLYVEAREDVYRYLLTLGLYPQEAQEGAQEVFLRLYGALKGGEQIQSPRAWIFRVAHNWGLNLRARRGPQVDFDAELASRIAGPEAGPERSLIDRERSLRLHRAIGGLSEQQRRCLFLRLEGLKYPEIAAALGISPSAVGEFLRRAITRLRGNLNADRIGTPE